MRPASVMPAMTGIMSPSIEIWPMKPSRAGWPKWMFSSRPRVGESPLAMYCLMMSDRLRAGDEDRSHVADQRLDDVALLVVERIRRRDRFAFLPEGAIEAADDFRLAEERDEAFLQRRASKVDEVISREVCV